MSLTTPLLLNIIDQDFGPISTRVFKIILLKGKITRAELVKQTGLSLEQVKSALLILLQHHCIAFLENYKNQDQMHTIPSKKKDSEAEKKVKTPSRGKTKQNKEQKEPPTKRRKTTKKDEELAKKAEPENTNIEGQLQKPQGNVSNGISLMKPIITYIPIEENILARVRFPRFVTLAKERFSDYGELLTQELLRHGSLHQEQAIDSAAKVLSTVLKHRMNEKKEKEKLKETFESMVHSGYIVVASSKVEHVQGKEGPSNLNPNWSSLLHFASTQENQSGASWKMNYPRFDLLFKLEVYIDYIRQIFGSACATVTKHGLGLVEDRITEEKTKSFTVQNLFKSIIKEESMTMSDLQQHLDGLANSKLEVAVKISGEQESASYVFDFSRLRDDYRERLVCTILTDKLGIVSARILRILLMHKQMEQNQIGSMALHPIKHTREILHKMLTRHYIQLQEIPRTADRSAARTLFLFYVDLEQLIITLRDETYKAIFNLRVRLQEHLERSQDLILRGEGYLTEEEKQALETVRQIQERLSFAQIQVSGTTQKLEF